MMLLEGRDSKWDFQLSNQMVSKNDLIYHEEIFQSQHKNTLHSNILTLNRFPPAYIFDYGIILELAPLKLFKF